MCGASRAEPEGEPLRHRPIRMTHDRENDAAFEDFLELWRKLLADSLVPGTIVVVEGERDPPGRSVGSVSPGRSSPCTKARPSRVPPSA